MKLKKNVFLAPTEILELMYSEIKFLYKKCLYILANSAPVVYGGGSGDGAGLNGTRRVLRMQ